ncbi:Uncharacterized protein BM_BM9102 [Brugia malayi]|uniref:BMA-ACBP-4, isoform b n=1 Tax=Brugia malayi TaxID=6279 RepID=A0A0K0JY47_BRUMA|nr:Uncharacterized protein BM_BM9102 [Brugia malayi]CDP92645.1 BMA-ACBP-4, isoform b [Brugia malayi]VIO90866.1 Uncharacterized protein BM_BM9102 [Brugia malayi]
MMASLADTANTTMTIPVRKECIKGRGRTSLASRISGKKGC